MEENGRIADELTKLADLHGRGVLSDAEFEEQKGALLGSSRRRHVRRGGLAAAAIVAVLALALLLNGTLTTSPSPSAKVTFSTTALTESQVQVAINYAKGQIGSSEWNQKCLALVAKAYSVAGVDIGSSDDPITYWASNPRGYAEHSAPYGPYGTPPAGAIMFWGETQWSSDGHAGISLGDGTVVSSAAYPYADGPTEGQIFLLSKRSASTYHYLGYIIPGDLEASPPPVAVAAPPTTTAPTTAPLKVSSGSSGTSPGSSGVQPASGGSSAQPASGGSSVQPASGGSSTQGGGGSSSSASGGGSTSASSGGGSTSSPGGTSTQVTPPTSHPRDPAGDEPTSAHDVLGDRRQCIAHVDELLQRGRLRGSVDRLEPDCADRLQGHRFRGGRRQHVVVPDRVEPVERRLLRLSGRLLQQRRHLGEPAQHTLGRSSCLELLRRADSHFGLDLIDARFKDPPFYMRPDCTGH